MAKDWSLQGRSCVHYLTLTHLRHGRNRSSIKISASRLQFLPNAVSKRLAAKGVVKIDRCQKVCIPLELFGGLDRPKNQLLNRKTTMARPTVEAKFHFEQARKFASDAGGYYMVAVGRQKPSHNELGDRYFTRALLELADGLAHLSDGLRATYILLEQLKNEMPQR
jgi:hypothetical protein